MKVCHITTVHKANDVRIFHKQCRSLQKHGFFVNLIAPNVKNQEIEGVKIIGLKPIKENRFYRIFKLSKTAYKLAIETNADIYHFHDPELLRIGLKLRKKGKKVIYDAHEDLPRQILTKHWINPILRKATAFLIEKYENYAATKMSAIIGATSHISNRFSSVNALSININNYPIISEFENSLIFNENNYIVYSGGISKERGIVEIINAIEDTQIQLLLAGKFLDPKLENELHLLKGWKNVSYLGFLSRSEISNVYKKSSIGMVTLHPTLNYKDSLPVKMFEYMASGIPIIASNFSKWKEIIDEHKCGITVNPKDSNDIKTSIENMINNPKEAKEMGENGKRAIANVFNWKIEEQKLIELYTNL
ncbi:MAG: glycosyl transferase [Crocinitomicaceae bacterium]|nr:glycosyl transferase [Crocinitomicaceae bacterium]